MNEIDASWDDEDFRRVTRLGLAARAGTLSEVCELCNKGANVNNQPEWDGWDFGMKLYASPLMEAAGCGSVGIVRELLQRGAKADAVMCDTDPTSSDDWHTDGWTVLMSAVSSMCLEVVELIVAQGVDVNARACRSQWVDRLETFEDRGTVTALTLARSLKLDAIAAVLAAKATAAPEPVPPVPPAALAAEIASLIAAKGKQATSGQPKRPAEDSATVSKRTRGTTATS